MHAFILRHDGRADHAACVSFADYAAATRVSETRKKLGSHEEHELQDLQRQSSRRGAGGITRTRSKGDRRGEEPLSTCQTVVSLVVVGLIFFGCLYWTVLVAMPR